MNPKRKQINFLYSKPFKPKPLQIFSQARAKYIDHDDVCEQISSILEPADMPDDSVIATIQRKNEYQLPILKDLLTSQNKSESDDILERLPDLVKEVCNQKNQLIKQNKEIEIKFDTTIKEKNEIINQLKNSNISLKELLQSERNDKEEISKRLRENENEKDEVEMYLKAIREDIKRMDEKHRLLSDENKNLHVDKTSAEIKSIRLEKENKISNQSIIDLNKKIIDIENYHSNYNLEVEIRETEMNEVFKIKLLDKEKEILDLKEIINQNNNEIKDQKIIISNKNEELRELEKIREEYIECEKKILNYELELKKINLLESEVNLYKEILNNVRNKIDEMNVNDRFKEYYDLANESIIDMRMKFNNEIYYKEKLVERNNEVSSKLDVVLKKSIPSLQSIFMDLKNEVLAADLKLQKLKIEEMDSREKMKKSHLIEIEDLKNCHLKKINKLYKHFKDKKNRFIAGESNKPADEDVWNVFK